MKPRSLISRGNDTVLPIIGDYLSEVCVGARMQTVDLAFSHHTGEAEIRIRNPILFRIHNCERMLTGSHPQTYAPLLSLLGYQVEDAIASPDGRLLIVLMRTVFLPQSIALKQANTPRQTSQLRVTLKIVPVDDFPRWRPRGKLQPEAWVFQYPRRRQSVVEWSSRYHVLLAGSSNKLVYLIDEKTD